MRRLALCTVGLLVAATASACSHSGTSTLTVLAASSLSGVLEPLQAQLRRAHPGIRVQVSYAGTPSLVAQVRSGADADVIITASAASLRPLVSEHQVLPPRVVATNVAVLVTPASNPGHVSTVADLSRRELRIALCDPSVPCGAVAASTLAADGVAATPDTLAPDVKTVLRLVTTGEADAGIVYRSDARAGAVRVIALPNAAHTSYPAAVVAGSKHQDLAREYVDLLLAAAGQALLRDAGFGPP